MRARGLKPGLFLNEDLGSSDPINTVVYAGLWCAADRSGRIEDRPLKIHMSVNPYRAPETTVAALNWLADRQFIVRYSVAGLGYIEIPKFVYHQHPHVNEKPSTLPPNPNPLIPLKHHTSTILALEQHQNSTRVLGLTPDSGLLTPDSCNLTPDPPFPVARGATENAGNGLNAPKKSKVFDPTDYPNLSMIAVNALVAYRRDQGFKPLKFEGMTSLAKHLSKYSAETQFAMIEQTKRNGWQGVFDLKAGSDTGGTHDLSQFTWRPPPDPAPTTEEPPP